MIAGPAPSPMTAPWWDAVALDSLTRPRCGRCARSFFTPQFACPYCGSTEWTYEPSTGLGTVYSHTVVHRPPVPELGAPYVLAIVDLDEGWHMLTRIVGCPPEEVRIGMRVSVTFANIGDRKLPVFEPVA